MPRKQETNLWDLVTRNKLMSLAGLGIVFAIIFSLTFGTVAENPANSLKQPAQAPYDHNIAGIGIVESSSGNINLGAFNPGIVSKVFVKEGDKIEAGDHLFVQDQRSAKASFAAAMNELEMAKKELDMAKKELDMAKVESKEQLDRFERAKGLKSTNNISQELYQNRKFSSQKADMDVMFKESKVMAAEKNLELAQIALDKTTIISPIDGIVLKVRIRPGEFISGNEKDINAPMLIGTQNPLHIKVKIDENDMWRFNKAMKAHAYLRSNQSINTPIHFVRIEPYASTKEHLRGSGVELIDTRIINIVYKVEENLDQFYIGQQLDVFIESGEGP